MTLIFLTVRKNWQLHFEKEEKRTTTMCLCLLA